MRRQLFHVEHREPVMREHALDREEREVAEMLVIDRVELVLFDKPAQMGKFHRDDATGRQQEVRGEGVIGEQPTLAPGERFEYTSGVPLTTASGFMTGRYQMVSASGERFEIDVPTFSLDSPDNKRVLN